MKKVLAFLMIAGFVAFYACKSGENKEAVDSTAMDTTVVMTVDTTVVDTTVVTE